ncbi:hypothetical protein [Rubritalea halochordaticola]
MRYILIPCLTLLALTSCQHDEEATDKHMDATLDAITWDEIAANPSYQTFLSHKKLPPFPAEKLDSLKDNTLEAHQLCSRLTNLPPFGKTLDEDTREELNKLKPTLSQLLGTPTSTLDLDQYDLSKLTKEETALAARYYQLCCLDMYAFGDLPQDGVLARLSRLISLDLAFRNSGNLELMHYSKTVCYKHIIGMLYQIKERHPALASSMAENQTLAPWFHPDVDQCFLQEIYHRLETELAASPDNPQSLKKTALVNTELFQAYADGKDINRELVTRFSTAAEAQNLSKMYAQGVLADYLYLCYYQSILKLSKATLLYESETHQLPGYPNEWKNDLGQDLQIIDQAGRPTLYYQGLNATDDNGKGGPSIQSPDWVLPYQ